MVDEGISYRNAPMMNVSPDTRVKSLLCMYSRCVTLFPDVGITKVNASLLETLSGNVGNVS